VAKARSIIVAREKSWGEEGGYAAGDSRLWLKTINHARDPCEHYYETAERGGKEREKRASSLMRTKDFGVFGLRVE
jgi:hypothetical protein